MRKLASLGFSLALVLVFAYGSFAQAPRNPVHDYPGKTNFSNVGISGLDVSGNAGYISLSGPHFDGSEIIYYLWVDEDGDLNIASQTTIESEASFPTGDWRRTTGFDPGTVVGTQS
jgi:hypothetical protein